MKTSNMSMGDGVRHLYHLILVLSLLIFVGMISFLLWPAARSVFLTGLFAAVLLIWLGLCVVFYKRLMRLLEDRNNQETQDVNKEIFLNAVISSAQDSIYLKDKDHRIVFANEYMVNSLAIPFKSLIGKSDLDLFSAEFAAVTAAQEDEIIESGKPLVNLIELNINAEGKEFWSSTTKVPVKKNGQVIAVLGITREFDEIAKIHQELEYSATHDQLTGLLNRAGVYDSINHHLQINEHMAVLFIDLDNFKKINDTYGHDFGDKVLCAVADRLKKVLRRDDVVGRYGGDEFVVLALGVKIEEADIVAHKILDGFAVPLDIEGREIVCPLSIGVVCCSEKVFSNLDLVDTLISCADEAMYEAKHQGKNRSVIREV